MKTAIKMCMAVALAAVVAGCSMDSVQLGEYVKKEMQAELVKTDGLKALKMKEVRLLKDDGIEYSGVGKGEINGHPVKFDVKCKYDGKTVLWDASLSDDNLLSLAAKEKAKEVYDKVKALWPEVQKGIKRKYDAASKKAGEFYNAATKKVEEGIDSVKESVQSGTGEETITMPPPGQGNSQQ